MAVFVVALCIRALHLWAMRDSLIYQALVGDAWQYDRWAASIADGQWIGKEIFYQTPLYPYTVGVLYAAFGHDPWIVRIVQSIASSPGLRLLARAVSRYFDQRTAGSPG